MNAVILTGTICGKIDRTPSKNGLSKLCFKVRTDGKELDLHFLCLAFGDAAQSDIVEGDEVLLLGTLQASAFNKTMALNARSIQVIYEAENGETNGENTK